MRAALIHNSGTLWLAGDPALAERVHSGVDAFRVTPRLETQTDLLVRAEEAAHTDRGNIATTVAFRTHRLFATPEAAVIWSSLYDRVMPRAGTMALCAPAPGLRCALNFPRALVLPPERLVTGVTVRLDYEILCGLPVEVTYASGTIEVPPAPDFGDAVTVAGMEFSYHTPLPGPPLWDSTAGLAYAINEELGTIVTAVADGSIITLTASQPGAQGNDITLDSTGGVDISGPTLSGGAGINLEPPSW